MYIYHTSRTVSAYNHVWQDNVEDGQTDYYLYTNVLHAEHPAHEITAHNSMERERYNQQYKAVCSNRIMSMMTNSNICTPITHYRTNVFQSQIYMFGYDAAERTPHLLASDFSMRMYPSIPQDSPQEFFTCQ